MNNVVSLKDLYFKARFTFKRINKNLNIDKALTLSQMSMIAFKESLYVRHDCYRIKLPIIKDVSLDKTIRLSMIGGRCQIFKCVETSEDVQCIDVVSLYPYVMLNNKYPCIKMSKDDNSI